MPNHVINKLEAPEYVLKALVNESGRVDFSLIHPFPGPHSLRESYCMSAESCAERAVGAPYNADSMIARLEKLNREKADFRALDSEALKQFVEFCENYHACGYLHEMDFARKQWGTKWNAYSPQAVVPGALWFTTAWAAPLPIVKKLSEKFQDAEIIISYAGEDLGWDCGVATYVHGFECSRQFAPKVADSTRETQVGWLRFARNLHRESTKAINEARQ